MEYIQIHNKRVDAELVRKYLGILWIPHTGEAITDYLVYDRLRAATHLEICQSVGYERIACKMQDEEDEKNNMKFLDALDMIICKVFLCLECEVSVGGSMLCPKCRRELTRKESFMLLETFVKEKDDE